MLALTGQARRVRIPALNGCSRVNTPLQVSHTAYACHLHACHLHNVALNACPGLSLSSHNRGGPRSSSLAAQGSSSRSQQISWQGPKCRWRSRRRCMQLQDSHSLKSGRDGRGTEQTRHSASPGGSSQWSWQTPACRVTKMAASCSPQRSHLHARSSTTKSWTASARWRRAAAAACRGQRPCSSTRSGTLGFRKPAGFLQGSRVQRLLVPDMVPGPWSNGSWRLAPGSWFLAPGFHGSRCLVPSFTSFPGSVSTLLCCLGRRHLTRHMSSVKINLDSMQAFAPFADYRHGGAVAECQRTSGCAARIA